MISKQYPLAVYVYCACHCLNLTLSSSSSISTIKWPLKTNQDCIMFLLSCPKRATALCRAIKAIFPGYNKTTLVALCTVRLVERHDTVIHFVELFSTISQCLNSLQDDSDTNASDKAALLSCRVNSFEFIISVAITKFVSGVMIMLSEKLGKSTNNLLSVNWYRTIIKCLSMYLQMMKRKHTMMFTDRLVKPDENFIMRSSTNLHSNPRDKDVEGYFYDNVFWPFLESVVWTFQTF